MPVKKAKSEAKFGVGWWFHRNVCVCVCHVFMRVEPLPRVPVPEVTPRCANILATANRSSLLPMCEGLQIVAGL